ncbi:hypothetical protein [Kocuria atrinae]|uniref:PIN like domain-containing protein n=1 Tax=Kocuria atrinae TaxID=592377 RepID=A0ABP5JSJ4_9MICC
MVDESSRPTADVLKRLSQVAAITSSNRLEDTLDWIIPMLTYFSEGPWRSADDWQDEIEASYGIDIPLHDIGESLSRLQQNKVLVWEGSKQQFTLKRDAAPAIEDKIEKASDLEDRVLARWIDLAGAKLPPGRSAKEWWQLLMDYCAPVFREHGIDAIGILTEDAPTSSNETHDKILGRVMAEHEVSEHDVADLKLAIYQFFHSDDPEIDKYISQLADSTYNLLALCIDEKSRASLQKSVPELKIFVDTNIILSLLGTHDTPLAMASIDLFRVISKAKLPFTLYYHAKTLSELTHTLEDACHRLQKRTWPQHASRAVVNLPWQATRMSGIEMRFHELNAKTPTDPRAFCARFRSPAALLSNHGLRIYRESDIANGGEYLELKATILADYGKYLAKYPRRKNTPYVKLDHDCSVWMTTSDHQVPNHKGLIFSGAFFLSSDFLLWRFDRDVMKKNYKSRPVVVLPDALLQALRPFVGGAQFNDRAFVQAFSASEFRAGGNEAELSETVRSVLSYLAAFEDLPEETAIRILSDNILIEGLQRYEDSAPEFAEAIEKAIFAHNEVLVRERDELLVERETQLGLAQQALKEASPQNEELLSTLKSLVESFGNAPSTPPVIQFYEGEFKMEHNNIFHNNQSQVSAQGSNPLSTENTFTQQAAQATTDPILLHELIKVKEQLLSVATSAGDFEVISGVQGAIEAVEEQDESKAASFLQRTGQKALDVAMAIGANVAAAFIASQLGTDS